MRVPTEKKFIFTIKPFKLEDGLYFYKMQDLKGTILFGYVIVLRLFGKNIL